MLAVTQSVAAESASAERRAAASESAAPNFAGSSDSDRDGRYEDVNGDGRADVTAVQTLFERRRTIAGTSTRPRSASAATAPRTSSMHSRCSPS
jgi:hypothetical protein